MKRFIRLHRALLLPVLLLVFGRLSADTIILKSGEKIECKIISETDTTFTYEYQLTPNIKDKKTINKSDVKELTRLTPAQVALQEKGLEKRLPTGDLLGPSDYESIIQDDMRTFVAKYPGTPEAAKVEELIKTLSEEKSKVLAGQLKMDGQWLDEATVKREKYNIDAYRVRLAMKARLAEVGDTNYIQALRQFDILRTTYPASPQYLQAIPEALDILEKYDKRLAGMIIEQPIINDEREKNLKALSGNDLTMAKVAIDQEERNFKANYDAQVKSKVKWRDIYKYDLRSLNDARLAIGKERSDLKSINLLAFQTEVENLSAAISAINDGKLVEAEGAMAVLRPTKTTLVNKKVFEEYEKKLKDLQAKQTAQAKATKAGAGNASAAGSGDGVDASNPIAVAMAKQKEEAKKVAKAKADAAAAAAPLKPAVEPEEEQTLLQKINSYIPYIGGGLLVVLIIAMVMGKKKKDEDD